MSLISRKNLFEQRFGRRSGFTLIELLVVISIIAFLVVTAAGVLGALSGSQISVSKNAVVANIDFARRLAVKEQRATAVLFMKDTQSQQYYMKTLVGVESYLPTVSGDPNGNGKYLPRFVEHERTADRKLGEDIEIRAFVQNGTDYYWQSPDDFYDKDVKYYNNLTPPLPQPLYLAIQFNADGSLYTGDSRGEERGVFLADGNPRSNNINEAIVFKRFARLVIYSKKDVERVYQGSDFNFDPDRDESLVDEIDLYARKDNGISQSVFDNISDPAKDYRFGSWLRLTEVDNVKRIVINANSGKAITATRGK